MTIKGEKCPLLPSQLLDHELIAQVLIMRCIVHVSDCDQVTEKVFSKEMTERRVKDKSKRLFSSVITEMG